MTKWQVLQSGLKNDLCCDLWYQLDFEMGCEMDGDSSNILRNALNSEISWREKK